MFPRHEASSISVTTFPAGVNDPPDMHQVITTIESEEDTITASRHCKDGRWRIAHPAMMSNHHCQRILSNRGELLNDADSHTANSPMTLRSLWCNRDWRRIGVIVSKKRNVIQRIRNASLETSDKRSHVCGSSLLCCWPVYISDFWLNVRWHDFLLFFCPMWLTGLKQFVPHQLW